jgi:hypothetical protein
MAEYLDLWYAGRDGNLSQPMAIERAMMAEIGRGAFIPTDATAFIVEGVGHVRVPSPARIGIADRLSILDDVGEHASLKKLEQYQQKKTLSR